MVQWRGRCLCDIKILWPEAGEPDDAPGAEARATLADDDPPAFGFVR